MTMNRRSFLSLAAATSALVAFDFRMAAAAGDATPVEVNSWIVISADNRVLVRVPQSEIGQGATTTLVQLLGDELDLDLAQVDWEIYDPQTNLARGNVYVYTATLASLGIEMLFTPMRIAGAQLRAMLAAGAAKTLGTAEGLVFANHRITAPDGASVSYFEAAQQLDGVAVPTDVTLKEAKDFNLIGQPVPRLDAYAKSTGQATYGIDVKLDGMKYAAVKQSPVFGGRLRSFDASAVTSMPGVLGVVRIKGGPSGNTVPPVLWDIIDWEMDDAVAVVADSWWTAKQALAALPIEWDAPDGALVNSADIEAKIDAALAADLQIVREEGDAPAALAGAETRVDAVYSYPYMEHAALEPMNATAVFREGPAYPGSIEVWAPTQFGEEAMRIAAYAAGVAQKDAVLHVTLAGGAFGRRLHSDFVSQVVQIAKQFPDVPIKMIASREETFARSYYAPRMKAKLSGTLGPDNAILAWDSGVVQTRSVYQPYGMSRLALPVGNIRVGYGTIDAPPPFAWMRGVGHSQNAWMNQGFVSELAVAAGQTTLDFMMAQLDTTKLDPARPDYEDAAWRINRFKTVLSDLVDFCGTGAEMGAGRGRGFSVYDLSYQPGLASSCIAIAVDVALDGKGGLKVEQVHASVDAGLILNPLVARGQIEGGIIFGLSNALNAEITLKDGAVEQTNFPSYPLMRMDECPEIAVRFLPSEGTSKGVGEGAVPVVIGALVDAIHAAGGPRIRTLPVLKQDLSLR